MAKSFRRVLSPDVRDSVHDRAPFRELPAPEGATNVIDLERDFKAGLARD